MILVLDACAIIAFLRNETGADVIEELLLDTNNHCFVHAINLCEVYYDFLRVADEKVAKSVLYDLNTLGIIVREDLDTEFWQDAGKFKASGKVSLADCFAIALTNRVGGELLTSDHREFDPIVAKGICSVRFFR